MAGEPDTDMRLRDGDVLTIRQMGGWKDVGASIKITGEVVHPGTYGIREGERLSSIIARAGGLRSDAYPYGAVFERIQIRELDEPTGRSSCASSPTKVRYYAGPGQRSRPETGQGSGAPAVAVDPAKLQNTPPAGRMVIHISKDAKRWRNSNADIEVRGDSIFIPKLQTRSWSMARLQPHRGQLQARQIRGLVPAAGGRSDQYRE